MTTVIVTLSITVEAAISGTCGANLTWSIDDEGTLIISGSGDMTRWSWLDEVPWCEKRADIKKIIISTGVTSLGNYASAGCANLTNVLIPDSVTRINVSVFWDCRSLASITIPDSVTSIGSSAFSYCSYLNNITIPDSVTDIGANVFYETAYFNNKLNWDNYVLYIGQYLVDSYINQPAGAYSIKIGTKLIADEAFYDNRTITSITIPDGVIRIGDSAFERCSKLTSVTIPDSVTIIGDYAITNQCDVFYGGDEEQWNNISVGLYSLNYNKLHYTFKINLNYIINEKESVWKKSKVTPGSDIELTTDIPIRTGHTFLGWATTLDAESAQYQPGDTITVDTEDVTLYAVWGKTTYTTSKKVNGIFMVSPMGVPNGSSIMLACYKDGKLVHIEEFKYDGSAVVPFAVNNEYDAAKVFVWNAVDSMVPVTESEDVTL